MAQQSDTFVMIPSFRGQNYEQYTALVPVQRLASALLCRGTLAFSESRLPVSLSGHHLLSRRLVAQAMPLYRRSCVAFSHVVSGERSDCSRPAEPSEIMS